MRSVHPRVRLANPWIPAAAAAFALLGCGGSEEGKSAQPAVKDTLPAARAKDGKAAQTGAPKSDAPADLPTNSYEALPAPLVAPLDGPPEYEEGTEKPLVASFPDARAPEAKRPAIALPADDPVCGRPLVINDKVVPFDEVKRQICLGAIGVPEIETAKLGVYIEEEIQRRVKAGAKKEDLLVGDAELDSFLKELDEQIKTEYPEGGMTMEDLFSRMRTDMPKERMRVSKLFEKLFMPDDPANYPPITVEAIMSNDGGDAWIQQLKETYAERKKVDGQLEKKSLDMRAIDDAILQQIVDYLQKKATIVADPAPGVLYKVNGVDLKQADIWERIKPQVTVMDVHAAKQWIVNTTLLKEALIAAGAWLSDEDADAAYHAHSDPFANSIFSYERIALAVEMFPSIERYKEYRHIWDSFAKLKAPEMTDEVLKKQGEFRTNKVVGQVSVDVDVILCSALDIKTGRWKENGWVDSEKRMREVLRLLIDEQRPWDEMVEKFSDFYEAPVPVDQRGQPGTEPINKGRFRNYQRNNLLSELGESEYALFLNGNSITDFIFFEQEVGTLGTPMRGPLGWYLPRLMRRTKPPRQLASNPDTLKALTRDDYLSWNLNRFAQELIKKNEVYGLDLPGT